MVARGFSGGLGVGIYFVKVCPAPRHLQLLFWPGQYRLRSELIVSACVVGSRHAKLGRLAWTKAVGVFLLLRGSRGGSLS